MSEDAIVEKVGIVIENPEGKRVTIRANLLDEIPFSFGGWEIKEMITLAAKEAEHE